jgi:competence protein ComEC
LFFTQYSNIPLFQHSIFFVGIEMGETFRLPLIPVFFSYAVGLYLGCLEFPIPSQAFLLTLPGLLAVWFFFITVKKILWGSCIGFILFFLLGIFSIQTYLHPPLFPSDISHFVGVDGIALEGRIDRPPERAQEGTQLMIRSRDVIVGDRHFVVTGDVLLFVREKGAAFRMGDHLRVLCRLDRPRGFQNPGGFSYERHLAFERVHTIGFASNEPAWVILGEGYHNPVLLWVERCRDHIRHFLEREVASPASSILKALVLGEQRDIPQELSEHFVVTGIAHLLAISGDHLGIVALLSFSVLIWILKRSEFLLLSTSVKKWAAGLTLPCILLYTFIAGGGISVIRATIMVILFFLSILLNRERHLLHTLGLAAFLILLVSPPSLFDVSFQLSFLAVLSILTLVPRLLPALKREDRLLPVKTSWTKNIWNYVKLSLLVTAVATFGTAPFVALHFNRISPMGLVSNLLFIPWVGFVIVPLAITASLLSFFVTPVAALLIHLAGAVTAILLQTVAFFASLPLASLFVSTPTVFEIILFYLILFCLAYVQKQRKVRTFLAGLCFILVLNVTYWNVRDLFQKKLTLTFLDVGQGDSILVEFPKGKRMLIDGGGLHDDRFDIGKSVIAPFLWNKKIRKIDYLVLTHPDPDHVKGLNFIASHFSIGQFWESGLRVNSDSFLRLERTLLEKGVKRVFLNERSSVQEISGVYVSVLNPAPFLGDEGSFKGDRGRSLTNNRSLVLKLQFRNTGVLLAGDVEKEAEVRILTQGHPVKADLLKIPHHGSLSSSTLAFLERVNPAYAVLSVAQRNVGRLPHPDVLKRYEGLNIQVFRTDRDGAVTVVTDGDDMRIRPFLRAGNGQD